MFRGCGTNGGMMIRIGGRLCQRSLQLGFKIHLRVEDLASDQFEKVRSHNLG